MLKKEIQINLRMSKADREAFDELAELLGLGVSSMLRVVVREKLAQVRARSARAAPKPRKSA